ncbi:hypothetical protein D3C71_1329390 [compost metagenome]
MLLHVQAVLQAQWQELFFVQLTGQKALDLITKLRNSFEHQCPVVVVVLIHLATSSELGTEPCRSELARDGVKGDAFIQEVRVFVDVHREQARSYRGRKSGSAARFEVTTMSLRRSTLQIHLNSKKPYQITVDRRRSAEKSDPHK